MAICTINHEGTDDYLWWYCEGCRTHHRVPVTGPKAWQFNQSLDAPTLQPSILVTWAAPDKNHVCHTFLTNGQVQFLSDCTHAFANQLRPLPEMP